MTPQTGQHVKCILRNGAIAEGIVEEWFNNVVQLKSLDGESVLIITHPAEDIMLIKILLDKAPEVEVPEDGPTEEEADAFASQFDEPPTDYNKPDEVKSLAELRIEKAKQERRIIAEKLREHVPTRSAYVPGTTPYHYPSVITGKPHPYQPSRIPNGKLRPSKKPRSQ